MRVVLDTNVLLSACMKPEGLEAQVVQGCISGLYHVFVTLAIQAEYRDVLSRPKFAAFHQTAEQLLPQFLTKAQNVLPVEPVSAALDEDDNRFLECAQAAAAHFLITGNLRDYPPMWHHTRIVNARQFLASET